LQDYNNKAPDELATVDN